MLLNVNISRVEFTLFRNDLEDLPLGRDPDRVPIFISGRIRLDNIRIESFARFNADHQVAPIQAFRRSGGIGLGINARYQADQGELLHVRAIKQTMNTRTFMDRSPRRHGIKMVL